jgi:hypothetical protein
MEVLILLASFVLALAATTRSLGWGFVVVLTVGYLNGILRANLPSVLTTFAFDASVLGLYLGFLGTPKYRVGAVLNGPVAKWVWPVLVWPLVVAAIPVNDFLVQMVALRGNLWLVPLILVAVRLTPADLALLSRGVAVLNLMALAVGVYLYQFGIEALYPQNDVTALMYKSKDVAGFAFHRIPSTFLSAHAYGGAMLLGLPFLFDRGVGRSGQLDKALAWAGIAAAVGGLLLCAARSPVVVTAAALLVFLVLTRLSALAVLPVVGAAAAAAYLASADERLQRAYSIGDTDVIVARVQLSANDSFLDLLVDYPFGAGMGSSVGTSIPFFLADRAPKQVGMENEYSRILIDQGVIGLILWLALLVHLYARPPAPRFAVPWRYGLVMMYAVTLVSWATAFIGTGTLSSIPGSVFLLVQMGLLARHRVSGQP